MYLRYTQEESACEQSPVAVHESHQSHDDAPAEQQDSHPVTRPHKLQHNVTGDLKQRIRYKKDGDSRVVHQRVSRHIEILGHACNLRIADCS